jgi:ABC-type phosphate transport system auxiliary subunit
VLLHLLNNFKSGSAGVFTSRVLGSASEFSVVLRCAIADVQQASVAVPLDLVLVSVTAWQNLTLLGPDNVWGWKATDSAQELRIVVGQLK